jgi:hypothetical protein
MKSHAFLPLAAFAALLSAGLLGAADAPFTPPASPCVKYNFNPD